MKTKYRNPTNIMKNVNNMRTALISRQDEIVRLEKEIGKSKNDKDLAKLLLMYKKQHVVLADLIFDLTELLQIGMSEHEDFLKTKPKKH